MPLLALPAPLDRLDTRITAWMARRGITVTRLALGLVFIWFGSLKFIPELSPATDIASRTLDRLTMGLVPQDLGIRILAGWEVLIGVGLLLRRFLRITILLLFIQMIGAMSPLILVPEETWRMVPFAPTLEGQYIIKNLVLIGAAIMIGSTVRGGYLKPEPPGVPEEDPPPPAARNRR